MAGLLISFIFICNVHRLAFHFCTREKDEMPLLLKLLSFLDRHLICMGYEWRVGNGNLFSFRITTGLRGKRTLKYKINRKKDLTQYPHMVDHVS